MEAGADRAPLESALRKAQWRILPLLALCYLVAYMDRTNISFAAESMNRDLHFSSQTYGLGAGLFFVSYALCEVPSNRLLLQFGARRWLACILGMGWMHDLTGGYAAGIGRLSVLWAVALACVAWVTKPRRQVAMESRVELIGTTEKSL